MVVFLELYLLFWYCCLGIFIEFVVIIFFLKIGLLFGFLDVVLVIIVNVMGRCLCVYEFCLIWFGNGGSVRVGGD